MGKLNEINQKHKKKMGTFAGSGERASFSDGERSLDGSVEDGTRGAIPAGALTVAAGWLVDGTGGPVQKEVLLQVVGETIALIRKDARSESTRAGVMDLRACTLLPGLADSHVHISLSGIEDPEMRRRQLCDRFEEAEGRIRGNLHRHLTHGVTAVRDGGDREGYALEYRRRRLSSKQAPVRLFTPGAAWHAQGRYGGMIGRVPAEDLGLAGSVARLRGRGDHLKIINSGPNSLTVFGKETPPQFGPDEMREAVMLAHSLGLKVMVHANGRLPVRWAIEAGADSIEHGYFMGTDNLKRMAEKGVTWVPTAFPMESLSRVFKAGSLEAEIARRNLDHQLEQIHAARGCGVPMALGTDSGSVGVHHGQALMEEMRILLSVGLSPQEAVQCASWRGACLIGLEGEMGRLVPGMPATFVAVEGGPEGLPESLESPEMIFIQGRPVSCAEPRQTGDDPP